MPLYVTKTTIADRLLRGGGTLLSYIQYDSIWVVATVGRARNSYKLLKFEPKNLAPNQFAYRLKIPFDRKAWLTRITEVELTEVKPPKLPQPEIAEALVEKDTPQKVLESLKGEG